MRRPSWGKQRQLSRRRGTKVIGEDQERGLADQEELGLGRAELQQIKRKGEERAPKGRLLLGGFKEGQEFCRAGVKTIPRSRSELTTL